MSAFVVLHSFQPVWQSRPFDSCEIYLEHFLLFNIVYLSQNIWKIATTTIAFLLISFTELHSLHVKIIIEAAVLSSACRYNYTLLTDDAGNKNVLFEIIRNTYRFWFLHMTLETVYSLP